MSPLGSRMDDFGEFWGVFGLFPARVGGQWVRELCFPRSVQDYPKAERAGRGDAEAADDTEES